MCCSVGDTDESRPETRRQSLHIAEKKDASYVMFG